MMEIKIFFLRFGNGIYKLIRCWYLLIFVMIIISGALFSLCNWDKIPVFNIIDRAIVNDLRRIIDTLIITAFFMVFGWLVVNISTSFQAKRIEGKVRTAMITSGMKSDSNICFPKLISRMSVKSDGVKVTIYRFYSYGISLAMWEKHKESILSVLSCHLTEDIQNGGKYQEKGHYIIIKTRKGVRPKPLPTFEDPLFKK